MLRYIERGEELADQAIGVRRRTQMTAAARSRLGDAMEEKWGRDFRRWFATAAEGMGDFLQEQLVETLPTLGHGLPPDDGKPRHVIDLENGEPWLQQALGELRALRNALGFDRSKHSTRRGEAVASRSPPERRSGIETGDYLGVVAILIAITVIYFDLSRSILYGVGVLALITAGLLTLTPYRHRVRRAFVWGAMLTGAAGALFAAAAGAFRTPATTYGETTGGLAATWTDYASGGGTQGPSIPAYTTIRIECRLIGLRVKDGNRWWYRIAQRPWNNEFYVSADAFYNNGRTSGSLRKTPFVDHQIPTCKVPADSPLARDRKPPQRQRWRINLPIRLGRTTA